MKTLLKKILKIFGAKLLLRLCRAIQARIYAQSDYRTRLAFDAEFFEAENHRHWNESRDVRRVGTISEERRTELNRRSQELVRETLAPFLEPGMALLDYGSGMGDSVAYYRGQGHAAAGAEISARLREYAQSIHNVKSIHPEELFGDESCRNAFDLIYSQAVLQYIHPGKMLELHRKLLTRLAPGGKIVHISCPSFAKRQLWIGGNKHKLAQTALCPLYSIQPPTFFIRETQMEQIACILGLRFRILPEPEWAARYNPGKGEWYRFNCVLELDSPT